jgi:hypothetical protein
MMKKNDQILCTRQVETAFSGISLPEFVSEKRAKTKKTVLKS